MIVAAVPIPVRATVRDLLRGLIDTPVVVRAAEEQRLTEDRASYLAVYRRDDGTPVAAAIVDLAGAAALGGAVAGTTGADPDASEEGTGVLADELHDPFAAAVDVLTTAFNGPRTERVRLDGVLAVPGPVPPAVAELVLEPAARVDYAIEVAGRGRGTITLVAR